MSPRTKEQYKNIREEKRLHIMSVALELFANEGYYTTSISRIATAAGISKGLIYNYFESKEDLIRSIMTDGFNKLDMLLDPDRDGKISNVEMRSFIEIFFCSMEADKHFWTLYFGLMLQKKVLDIVKERLQATIDRYITMLTDYFRDKGVDDPETDALIFGAMLDGIGFNFITSPEVFPVNSIKKWLINKYC